MILFNYWKNMQKLRKRIQIKNTVRNKNKEKKKKKDKKNQIKLKNKDNGTLNVINVPQ